MRVKFVPQDLWIGLYFKNDIVKTTYEFGKVTSRRIKTTFFICLLPCLPIIIERTRDEQTTD